MTRVASGLTEVDPLTELDNLTAGDKPAEFDDPLAELSFAISESRAILQEREPSRFEQPPVQAAEGLQLEPEQRAIEQAREDELFQQALSLPSSVSAMRRFNQIRADVGLPPTEELPPIDAPETVIDDLKSVVRAGTKGTAKAISGVSEFTSAIGNSIPLVEKLLPDQLLISDLADYVAALADLHLPDDARLRGTFQRDLFEGLGTTAPYLAAAVVGGAPLAIAAGVGAGASEARERAVKAGASERAQRLATIGGGLVGSTEAALPGVILRPQFTRRLLLPLDRFIRGALTRSIVRHGGQLTAAGATEAFQEGLIANPLQNLIARELYDQNQEIFDGARRSAEVGGAVGLILAVVAKLAGIPLGRFKSPEAQAGAEQGAKVADEASAQAHVQPREQAPLPPEPGTLAEAVGAAEDTIKVGDAVTPVSRETEAQPTPSLEEARAAFRMLRRRGLGVQAAARQARQDFGIPANVSDAQIAGRPEGPAAAPTPPVAEPIAAMPVPQAEEGQSVTSIKNAVVDQERAVRGLPPAMEPARRSFGVVWTEATHLIDEQPSIQDSLIAELKDDPRPVSDTEDALLLQRQISLQNEYDKVLAKHDESLKADDIAAVAQSESQQEVLLAELLELYDINKAVGTATARGLNARKLLAAEDFTLVRMVAMKRKAKGVTQLSAEDTKSVVETQQKIVDLEARLRTHTERITELEAEAASEKAVKDIVASEPKRTKKRTAAAKTKLENAWKDFEGQITGKLFANPLDPELIASAAKVAKAYINVGVAQFQDFIAQVTERIGKAKADQLGEALKRAWDSAIATERPQPTSALETPELVSRHAKLLAKFFVSTGVTERDALIDAVHEELSKAVPGLTRRQAMDAISGYGQFSQLSKADLDVLLRDLKGQMQQVAKLEDMQAGRAPSKTGVERRAPSDEERRLIQQVNEMKKHGGFDITDPATQLQSAIGAVKTRLRNQISDLEQQIAAKEKIVKKRLNVPQDEEVQRLTARRDALRKQFDEIFGKPELTNEQRVAIATASAKRSIAEYERRIAKRDFVGKKPTTKVRVTRELQALRDRRDALRAEFNELKGLANPKKTPEQRALSALKTRLRTRIADFQDRLARKDFAPRVRKKTPLDKEADKLRFKAEHAKEQFMRDLAKDARQRRTLTRKILGVVPEALNTSRAILTSFDLSAVGRQGGIVVFGNPVRGAKAMGVMFQSFFSKAGASRARSQLEKRPNAALYRRAKLEITDPEGRLSQQEEIYMARWSKVIPIVAASERAYVSYLNRIRADTFDALTATLGRGGSVTEAEAKVIANYVNVATGRGDLGKFRAAAVPMATTFFAPRYVLSRFQFLTFQPLRLEGNTARTRKLIAGEYAKMLTGLGLFFATASYALYALLGLPGDDEEWNIETDPRSSDFAKIRIGDTRIDPLFGLSQVTVLFARLLAGETKKLKSGKIIPIRGEKVPFGSSTGSDVVFRFVRTKLSPVIGTSINAVSGTNVIGERVTPKTLVRDLTIPISMRDIGTMMKEHGVPAGSILNLLEIFGMSTQHYDNNAGSRGSSLF